MFHVYISFDQLMRGVFSQILPATTVHDGSVIFLPWLEDWHATGHLNDELLLKWHDYWHNTSSQPAFDVDANVAGIDWDEVDMCKSSSWDDVSWDAPLTQNLEDQNQKEATNVWVNYVRYLDTSRKHRKRVKRALLRKKLFEAGDEFFLSVLAGRKAVYEVKEQRRLQKRQRAAEIRFEIECNAIRQGIQQRLQSRDVPMTDTTEQQTFFVEKLVCCREAAMKESFMDNVRHAINKAHVHHRRRKVILDHLGIPSGQFGGDCSSKVRKKRVSKLVDGKEPDFEDSPARNTRSKAAEDTKQIKRPST